MNENGSSAPSPYIFMRGQRGVFAEVYFPKRVIYQPEIFTALKQGLDEDLVKEYLTLDIRSIKEELYDYPNLFDPHQYERDRVVDGASISMQEALQRISQYRSPFFGWSMYEVDGVFWSDKEKKVYDERTQVIRLIFRFESALKEASKTTKCYDVFEALMRWVMAEQGRLDEVLPWSKKERDRFLAFHDAWPEHKREFVEKYYQKIAQDAKRWIDDIGLFVFGYLVRRFWQDVMAQQESEEEIWVASAFNLNLNIIVKREGKESA